jgi:hypothetical protein
MSVEDSSPGSEERPITELERIRDIIFGPQMQDYEGQFGRVAAELGLLSQQLGELKSTLAQQRADQEQRLAELESRFGDQTQQLANDLQAEFTEALEALQDDKASRLDMGDILVEMGTRLKQQFGMADLLGPLDDSDGDDLFD